MDTKRDKFGVRIGSPRLVPDSRKLSAWKNSSAACLSCDVEFVSIESLMEHWNKYHKEHECLRCRAPRAQDSTSLFCDECLQIDDQNLRNFLRLERARVRAELRVSYWQAVAEKIGQEQFALAESIALKFAKPYTHSEIYCAHGLKQGRCAPCNPIFANITHAALQAVCDKIPPKSEYHSKPLQWYTCVSEKCNKIAAPHSKLCPEHLEKKKAEIESRRAEVVLVDLD